MSPLVVLFFLCHLTCNICTNEKTHINRHLLAGGQIPPQGETNNAQDRHETNKEEEAAVVHVQSKKKDDEVHLKPPEVKAPIESAKKSISQAPTAKNGTKSEDHQTFKTTEMESGALLRGVSVVVALTTLVIIYMALKTYCGKKARNPAMVSKYGVRTRRSDIEMTPLPLDEDEDDETLFDVSSTNR